MQLDREMLNKLLLLNDRQLQSVIEKLVAEYGLDISRFRVRPGDMESLRRAIKNASDDDLTALAEQFRQNRK